MVPNATAKQQVRLRLREAYLRLVETTKQLRAVSEHYQPGRRFYCGKVNTELDQVIMSIAEAQGILNLRAQPKKKPTPRKRPKERVNGALMEALISLGLKQKEALPIAQQVAQKLGRDHGLEEGIRLALKLIKPR